MYHPFFCLIALFSCLITTTAVIVPVADDGCERNCGDIFVPNPFGLDKCPKTSFYNIKCNRSTSPPTLLLGNIPMLNISLEDATVVVTLKIAHTCYSRSGEPNSFQQSVSLGNSPFLFSTRNNFTVIGCDTIGLIGDQDLVMYSGCLSVCNSSLTNQYNFTAELISCRGIGCCQTAVPQELKTLGITLSTFKNHSGQLDTNPCSFGFLSDPSWYKDSSKFSLGDTVDKHGSSPLLLDWAIRGNITCADTTDVAYMCGINTNCISSYNGPGYLCSCIEGFIGNPYTKTGCQDINECDDPKKYPCNGKCKNTPGGYTCACSFGKDGDGKFGCSISARAKVVVAAIAGSLLACGMGILIPNIKKWYVKKMQEKKQLENGRLLLKHLSVRNFSKAELEKATNNYNVEGLLGEGGNGWVYKGILADNTEIAVKKSKVLDENQIQQFLNEVDIVSKINHKNVVKLLGICVETEVPMLVYEFVPNGTLSHHIRWKNSKILYSWPSCLRISAETSGALDYMHSLAYPPIIHRDIKSANILLDGKYTAKVADFGASKLIQLDGTVQDTQGQGTMGYLDPEYLQTGELTTKSDVYGFGVVLMELLSKEKPISRGTSGEMLSLVKVFTLAVEENELDQVIKFENISTKEREEIKTVAMLAVKCASMSGKHRPTMKEVWYVLDGLSNEYQIFQTEGNQEELARLLVEEQFITDTSPFYIDHSIIA